MAINTHRNYTKQLSEPEEDPTDHVIRILRKYLTSEWTRKRTPCNLKSSWQSAKVSERDSIERILLDAGFQAWLAYFLATSCEAHFEGRSMQVAALNSFQQYNIDDKKRVTREVAATIPHAS